MRLANKTALITGGYSGIALATARLFLAEGAQVVIIGRNKTTLNAAAETLGGHVLALQADVTEVEAVEHAVAATAERFGKLDIVFANAGIAEGWSAYAAAKGGVRSMTRNLASVSRVGRRSERDCHGDRGGRRHHGGAVRGSHSHDGDGAVSTAPSGHSKPTVIADQGRYLED